MSTLITKDMPEPKEYGPFLVATNDGKPLFIAHHRKSGPSTSWSDIEMEECSWYKLRAVAGGYTVEGGCTIESFADHDARIRREALALTDEELSIAADALQEADEESWAYDSREQIIKDMMTAIAENRERVS